ncbi:hypothetical protein [Stappia sp. ES.058]|uniref:hypothetical protein n=1 Tax=Stappia sp. ES.058 TaxID=1881061 RepID=UPI00087B4A7D|nr:hypothetical protein [Stappia sp. ES.058]SDU33554.1 hypothetical protein SAMN05428979_3055 [Stappia sp. ES.058]
MQMKRPCDLRRRFVARTAIRAALAFAALSLVLGTARADFVVLAASGTSDGLETGTRLADDARIALQKGAKVTLMSRDGRMLTLEGSYSGLVDPQSDAPAGAKGSRGPLEKLSRLLQGADARSTVLGAARAGAGTVPPPPGIWHVSVDSSGPRCVRPGSLQFWRRDAARHSPVTLRSASGRRDGLTFEKGTHVLTVEDALADDDDRLLVSLDDNLRDLAIAHRPDALADASPGELLVWMLDNDCKRQALTLIGHVHAGRALR